MGDPQSFNKYSYVRNNPLKYTDPTGRDFRESMDGYVDGIWQGAGETWDSLSKAASDPIGTGKNIVVGAWDAGNAAGQYLNTHDVGQIANDSYNLGANTINGIGQEAQRIADLPDYERGNAVGKLAWKTMESVTAAKGIGKAVDYGLGAKALGRTGQIIRDAAKGRGDFGVGAGTYKEALKAGESWVGKGYNIAKDGKIWISEDKLRQFRLPEYKPKLGITQANFESRSIPKGDWPENGHLKITK